MAEVKWNARRLTDGVMVDVTADIDGMAQPVPTENAIEAGGGEQTIRLLGPFTIDHDETDITDTGFIIPNSEIAANGIVIDARYAVLEPFLTVSGQTADANALMQFALVRQSDPFGGGFIICDTPNDALDAVTAQDGISYGLHYAPESTWSTNRVTWAYLDEPAVLYVYLENAEAGALTQGSLEVAFLIAEPAS